MKFFSILTLFLLACCSSKVQISDADLGPEPLPWAGEGVEAIQSRYSAAVSSGVFRFFPNVDKAIGVESVLWGKPVEVFNPGVDCELRREKLGPPLTTFACRIEGPDDETVEVKVFEQLTSNQRLLNRIVIKTSNRKLLPHWVRELRASNFRSGNYQSDKTQLFFSPRGQTKAWLSHNGSELTLMFEPPNSR